MNRSKVELTRADQQRYIEVADKRQRMKLIVVDSECFVILDSIEPHEHELRLLLSDNRKRFRGDAETIVKALLEHCVLTGDRHSRAAFLDAQRFIRLTRLDGGNVSLFAVSVESFRGGDSLSRAARKFRLTPREIDVLALILEGANATETADTLKIAETTVHGYYKRLLSKTGARNRPAMVATVLDWAGRRERR
jgi:DNA-binding CsgD family transcriptional regulator